MRHLNYSHLQYFWAVAREGSIVRASEALNLTPQTISGQLKLLDAAVGQALFNRVGRRLVLSETGQVVFRYADEIFSIGAELANVVRGRAAGGPEVLNVGIVSSMPKLVVERIIAPAVQAESPVWVRCQQSALDQLLADLAIHRLDIVLADQPMPTGLGFKAWDHLLGTSGLSFFASRRPAAGYRRRFPGSLDRAPMLMPSRNSALRRGLDRWFAEQGIAPRVVGEFDDSALMKAFGDAGMGLFAAPTVIEEEVSRMYRMSVVGRVAELEESFYAISAERRLTHGAVVAITDAARRDLFAADS